MIVKTIIDQDSGRKWEIIKHATDRYSVKYYEFFQSIGWRLLPDPITNYYTKDYIEWEFDVVIA